MDEIADRNSVAIERIVDAPVHRVWQMWTDPVRFATWYGPTAPPSTWTRWTCRLADSDRCGWR